jgi:cell division protein FtsL
MSASGAQLMVKILMGLIAVVAIAVGGFFGFEFYTQHRIAGEVETAFEQIRAGGGKASHGKVSFDLRSRTLRIADIATESGL